ncbi:hypothetical protein, partial [Methylogaea oryzae]
MAVYSSSVSTVLVASDNVHDAALAKKLLDVDFGKVLLSIDPVRMTEDFDHRKPDVLVLAFRALEKSVRHYLELLHLGGAVQSQPHRTVVLCGKEEVPQAYELCRDGVFNDYVLFWPMADDALRLPMAAHNALRSLAAVRAGWPAAQDLAVHNHRLARQLEL